MAKAKTAAVVTAVAAAAPVTIKGRAAAGPARPPCPRSGLRPEPRARNPADCGRRWRRVRAGHRAAGQHGVEDLSDWWDILGVSPNADPQEIKLAYYYLAKQFHPDQNNCQEAVKSMQVINYAYNQFRRFCRDRS